MKIIYVETENGFYISVKSFCQHLHAVGLLTEKQSNKHYWDLLTFAIADFNKSIRKGIMDNIKTPIIVDTKDFYMSWTFFNKSNDYVPILLTANLQYKNILWALDSPQTIRDDTKERFFKSSIMVEMITNN